MVEAKVGNTELTVEQLETYLDLARLNGIDTVLTLSNQFAPLPSHHPVRLPVAAKKKVELFHWSWSYVLTEASLLLANDLVASRDQRVILHELVRFLNHQSAGVRGFDQMPAAWPELVGKVQSGAKLSSGMAEAKEVIGAWHQELRDLSLILSRKLSTEVITMISRSHAADPGARFRAELAELIDRHCLMGTLVVPDAASPVELCVDLQRRSVILSMRLRAPGDRKSTKARTGWLLRQLLKSEGKDIHVRFFWPGRATHTQYPLEALRQNVDLPSTERPDMVVSTFEILLVNDLGARFAQRRNFISDLEDAVPAFYEQVGQHLKAWVAPAPKLPEHRAEPDDLVTEGIQADVEPSEAVSNLPQ